MLLHLRSWPSLQLSHLLGERSSLYHVACVCAVLAVLYVPGLRCVCSSVEKQATAAAYIIGAFYVPEQGIFSVTKLLLVLPQTDVSSRLATYTVAPSHSRSRSLQAAKVTTVHFVNTSEAAAYPGLRAVSNNITNDVVTLSFNPSTGLITQLVNKQANKSVDLGIDFVTYLAGKAELNGTTGPPSGLLGPQC